MPGMPPPVADERDTRRQDLDFNQRALFALTYGLPDEQARSTPTAGALSIGGLIKHVAGVQEAGAQRVIAAPDFPSRDDRPIDDQMADRTDQLVMRDDQTLEGLLKALEAQNAATVQAFEGADLDRLGPVAQ